MRHRTLALAGALALAPISASADTGGETCTASVYWEGFGRPLADGRMHRPSEIIVALPDRRRIGRVVRITNPRNGRSVVARVADLGPAHWTRRCVDLSSGTAAALGFGRGVGPVFLDHEVTP